jgi:hypothetical protein
VFNRAHIETLQRESIAMRTSEFTAVVTAIVGLVLLLAVPALKAQTYQPRLQPQCTSPTSENCYLWNNIYKGGTLNCQQTPTNPACQSVAQQPGNGGGNDSGSEGAAAPLELGKYGASVGVQRDVYGRNVVLVREVCVGKPSLEQKGWSNFDLEFSPDPVTGQKISIRLKRIADLSQKVPKVVYGAPAYTQETLASYTASSNQISFNKIFVNYVEYQGKDVGFDVYYDNNQGSQTWIHKEFLDLYWPNHQVVSPPADCPPQKPPPKTTAPGLSNGRTASCEPFLREADSIGGPVGRCQLLCMARICENNDGVTASPLFNQCGRECRP